MLMTTAYRIAPSGLWIRYDDFNRSDGGLGANWSLLPNVPAGDADLQIVSGRVRSVAGNPRGDQWRNDFPYPLVNQFAEVTVANWTGTTDRLGAVLLREQSDADSCYEFSVNHKPGQDYAVIAKVTNEAYSELSPQQSYVAQVGDRIRGEAVGNQLTLRINGNLIYQLTDSTSPHTTGYPGIATIVLGGGPNSDCELDDWVGGEL